LHQQHVPDEKKTLEKVQEDVEEEDEKK